MISLVLAFAFVVVLSFAVVLWLCDGFRLRLACICGGDCVLLWFCDGVCLHLRLRLCCRLRFCCGCVMVVACGSLAFVVVIVCLLWFVDGVCLHLRLRFSVFDVVV